MLPLYGMDLRLLEWFVLLLFGLMVVYIGGVCLFCFGLIVTWLLVGLGCCGVVVYLVSFGFLGWYCVCCLGWCV